MVLAQVTKTRTGEKQLESKKTILSFQRKQIKHEERYSRTIPEGNGIHKQA